MDNNDYSQNNNGQPYDQQAYGYQQPPYNQPYNQPPQYQYQYQQPYNNYYQKPSIPGRNFAIAGLVLGIVSLIMFAIIAGPLAIIFGGVARSKGDHSAMATSGIVLGIIGIVLWILTVTVFSSIFTAFLYGY